MGNACGLLSHWIIMSLNKRLSDKPKVKMQRKARCSKWLSKCAHCSNGVDGWVSLRKQCPFGSCFSLLPKHLGAARWGKNRWRKSDCIRWLLMNGNAVENIPLRITAHRDNELSCLMYMSCDTHLCMCALGTHRLLSLWIPPQTGRQWCNSSHFTDEGTEA